MRSHLAWRGASPDAEQAQIESDTPLWRRNQPDGLIHSGV
jgi:hypothetical protein